MTKRACQGKTKKGKPCKAAPLKDSDYCLAHSDKETRESTGFGGAQDGAGRPRLPRPSEVAQELVEANITAVLSPYFKALGFEVKFDPTNPLSVHGYVVVPGDGGAKVVHRGWDGERAVTELSDIDDLGAQMHAAELLQNRIYGRPRQALEHTGPEGQPLQAAGPVLDLSKLSTDELRTLAELHGRARSVPEDEAA